MTVLECCLRLFTVKFSFSQSSWAEASPCPQVLPYAPATASSLDNAKALAFIIQWWNKI